MTITISCPCGHDFEVRDSFADASAQCPACRRWVRADQDYALADEADDSAGSYLPDAQDVDPHAYAPPYAAPPALAAGERPAPLPVLPLSYAGPRPPGAIPLRPGDTDTAVGYKVGAILILCNVLIQVIPILVSAAYGVQSPAAGPQTCGMLVGIALAGAAAYGLWGRANWAKWIVLIGAALGAVMLVWLAQSQRPPAPPPVLYMMAGWGVVAWFLTLDRPATPVKVAVGLSLLAGWYAATFVVGLHVGS